MVEHSPQILASEEKAIIIHIYRYSAELHHYIYVVLDL